MGPPHGRTLVRSTHHVGHVSQTANREMVRGKTLDTPFDSTEYVWTNTLTSDLCRDRIETLVSGLCGTSIQADSVAGKTPRLESHPGVIYY